MLKTCCQCGEVHEDAFFNRDRSRDDGRDPRCKNCTRRACKQTYRKHEVAHRAMKQSWKDENRARHRQINREWREANPERVRMGTANYRARLARATPPWVDKAALARFREGCPDGWHVDHVFPLAGANCSGLNVPWNLQYLPANVHWQKGTKLPVDAEDQVKFVIR